MPSIQVAPLVQWELGDHWAVGPKRDIAMRQTHTVQLLQPMLGVDLAIPLRSYAVDRLFGVSALLNLAR